MYERHLEPPSGGRVGRRACVISEDCARLRRNNATFEKGPAGRKERREREREAIIRGSRDRHEFVIARLSERPERGGGCYHRRCVAAFVCATSRIIIHPQELDAALCRGCTRRDTKFMPKDNNSARARATSFVVLLGGRGDFFRRATL